jgi:hypothetical protein
MDTDQYFAVPLNRLRKLLISFIAVSCAAFGGNAAAQGVDIYSWSGLCSDCSSTGDTPAVAELTLQNYVAGSQLSASNFVSLSYQSVLYSLSFYADSNTNITGLLPGSGSTDAPISLSGLTDSTTGLGQFSFTTVGDGSWMLALNGVSFDEHGSDHHDNSSSWSFDHHDDNYCGPISPVPEPESYAMLFAGLGLLGFAARRRKQKEAAQA